MLALSAHAGRTDHGERWGVEIMTTSYLGLGLYTIQDATRATRIPEAKLRRWINGSKQHGPPVFPRPYPDLAERGVLTFHELIQLRMIQAFRDQLVPLVDIRIAVNVLMERWGTQCPLAVRGLFTDGRRLIMELRGQGRISARLFEELPNGQLVFDFASKFFTAHIDYEAELARYYWPLGKEKGIVLDPHRNFGRPILHESRVPTEPLYQMYCAGESVEAIAEWYGVTPHGVNAAILYERPLAA
jgi:uncharacterized protein (DUF433 family)